METGQSVTQVVLPVFAGTFTLTNRCMSDWVSAKETIQKEDL